jgi:hypothetical protein
MGLLDLLPTSNLGLQGTTPAQIPSANPNSTLHYESSINDTPHLPAGYPAPSALDLDGITPPKYLDNPPG